MSGSLSGQAYIVTGGSRGIGLAAAVSMAARGARVALFARNAEALQRAAERIGPAARPVAVDVGDRVALMTAIDDTAAAFGRLDGIINNAGLSLASPVEKLDPAEVVAQVNVNLLAVIYASQAIIPHLKRQGGGRIINVSSATVRHAGEFSLLSIYAATKAGVERFSVELREEVKADNIGITVFSPGGTETAFGSDWRPEMAAAAFEVWLKSATEFDGIMASEPVGEAIARCLEAPPGAAFDYVELRPNKPMSRQHYAETLYAARANNI